MAFSTQNTEDILCSIEEGISYQNRALFAQALEKAISGQVRIKDIMGAFFAGMEAGRKSLSEHSLSIPEFILSCDILLSGLGLLKQSGRYLSPGGPKVVIGVIMGDVHDMGKNIIAGALTAFGCRVIDLGRDVSPENFLLAARNEKADVVAISCMMSTPIDTIKKTVELLRLIMPDIPIMLGGAALSEALTADIGADSYVEMLHVFQRQ